MSTSGSGGSEPSASEKLRGVPVTPSVTRKLPTIALRRGADARLRLDVEQRLDVAGRRGQEIDGAAGDDVAVALEHDAAAVDFGAAEDRRPIVGALQLEIGAGHDVREVVLDAQRVVRGDLDVEAERQA